MAAGISVALDDGSSTEAPAAVAEVAPSIVVDHPALAGPTSADLRLAEEWERRLAAMLAARAAVERPGHISFDLMTRKDAQHNPVPAAAEAEVERPGHVHPEFLTRKDAQHDTAGS